MVNNDLWDTETRTPFDTHHPDYPQYSAEFMKIWNKWKEEAEALDKAFGNDYMMAEDQKRILDKTMCKKIRELQEQYSYMRRSSNQKLNQ